MKQKIRKRSEHSEHFLHESLTRLICIPKRSEHFLHESLTRLICIPKRLIAKDSDKLVWIQSISFALQIIRITVDSKRQGNI